MEREKGNLLTIIGREKSSGRRNLRVLKAEICFPENGVLINRSEGSQTLVKRDGRKGWSLFLE